MTCPLCDAEFIDGVETCSDCHVHLVRELQTSPERLGPADTHEVVAWGLSAPDARSLTSALNHAELPHGLMLRHTEEATAGGLIIVHEFDLFVRPEDVSRAAVIVELLDAAPALKPKHIALAAEHEVHPFSLHGLAPLTDEEADQVDFDVPDVAPPQKLIEATERLRTLAIVSLLGAVAFATLIRDSEWWSIPVAGAILVSVFLFAKRALLWKHWRASQRNA